MNKIKSFFKNLQETRNAECTVIIVCNDYESESECKEKSMNRLKIPE